MEPVPAPTRRTSTAQYRRRTRLVWVLVGIGLAMVAVYSTLFQVIMAAEGQPHSWASGIYWTVSTMSTLGYGDITFTSDIGRLFSVWVLISGAIMIALLVPFAMIQFVVTPWLDQREASRAPRRAPADLSGHLIITGSGSVVQALLARTRRAGLPALLIVPAPEEAAPVLDAGHHAVVGALDSTATYQAAGVGRAAMVISTLPDAASTNTVLSVRAVDADVPIAVVAEKAASVDVLTAAGADHVVPVAARLGQAMAQRVLGTTGRAHVIGDLGATVVAEAAVVGTELAGKDLDQVRRAMPPGVRVLAALVRGRSHDEPGALPPEAVLVLAGSETALDAYDARFTQPGHSEPAVVILGGGRVGRAAAAALAPAAASITVVEHNPDRPPPRAEVVYGDAAQAEVLQQAGLDEAAAVLVTTHDDDLNVYLTVYCRQLRPGVQVVARAMNERNRATLHRAGADSVLSYATIGAGVLWNELGVGRRVVVAEGVELFTTPVPAALAGAGVDPGPVFERTGARVVAVIDDDGALVGEGTTVQPAGHRLVVLGDRHAEERFRRHYLRRTR